MIKKELLEKKEWEYYIHKIDNNNIELSIPIPNPPPGFDVIHTLNLEEKNLYLEKGINLLENRIKDMQTNPSNYKMNSWR